MRLVIATLLATILATPAMADGAKASFSVSVTIVPMDSVQVDEDGEIVETDTTSGTTAETVVVKDGDRITITE